MLAFLRKNQVPLSSCFCVLLSIYILTVGARGQLRNEPLGAVVMWILRPLQIVSQGTVNWISGFRDNYDTLSGFKAENERLRKRVQNLEVERQKHLEAEATNQRLQQLLALRSHLSGTAITASIIANSADRLVSKLSARQRQRRRSAQRHGRGDAVGCRRPSGCRHAHATAKVLLAHGSQ